MCLGGAKGCTLLTAVRVHYGGSVCVCDTVNKAGEVVHKEPVLW